MTGNEYQKLAMVTANKTLSNQEQLTNGVMGLSGESGECCDAVKKYLFQGHELNGMDIMKELGDCLWYVALTATALNYDLDTIMKANIDKLATRYPDGFSEYCSTHRAEYL